MYRLSAGPAVGIGGMLGLLLYAINFYAFTAAFEWFAMARNWVSVLAHLAFGLVAICAYKAMERRRGQIVPA